MPDEEEVAQVAINTGYIRLDSFLKWSGIVLTGGQAKVLVEAGEVLVNDQEEHRRGRKLVDGDIVEVRGGGRYRVVKES